MIGGSSCGSSKSAEPTYSISPGPTSIVAGASEKFAVTTAEPVTWGIDESAAAAPAGDDPALPLKVSANGRYLVDQHDRPWRVQADAAWLIPTVATPDQVDQYLSIRHRQGFNSFYLMAMVHPGGYKSWAPDAPDSSSGDPPFAVPGDFSTAGDSPESARYWDWIDSIIAKAAAEHIVVMLSYSYLGYGGGDMGWYQEILNQPDRQALFDWGAWLGNRYKDTPNIIWFGLGDFTPPSGSEGSARVNAIAEGIKSTGAPQPFMAESSPPDSLPSETDFGSIVDMNSFYGYGPEGIGTVYETADRAWRVSPPMPAWMEEGTYENENNWGHFSGEPWDTRRGRFWSVLAGGTAGDGFGSKDVWQWNDFPDSLSSPGAQYSIHAFDLFASLAWWELQPSGTDPGFAGKDLVVAGQGTWGELDYITSALTTHHDWLLAYVPVTEQGERSFDVDMSALQEPARARWFDPATGNYLAISDGYDLPNSGTRTFTTPGSRDDGTDDWLLVLDSTGAPRCGSITTTGVYTAPSRTESGVTCEVTATLRSDPSVIARATVTVEG